MIGLVSGCIAVFGVIFVERIGIDDPIGAVAVHGMSGVWGTLAMRPLRAFRRSPKNARDRHAAASSTPARFHQLGVQALGLAGRRRVHLHGVVRLRSG